MTIIAEVKLITANCVKQGVVTINRRCCDLNFSAGLYCYRHCFYKHKFILVCVKSDFKFHFINAFGRLKVIRLYWNCSFSRRFIVREREPFILINYLSCRSFYEYFNTIATRTFSTISDACGYFTWSVQVVHLSGLANFVLKSVRSNKILNITIGVRVTYEAFCRRQCCWVTWIRYINLDRKSLSSSAISESTSIDDIDWCNVR